jgi:hypothetical protein
MPPTLTLLHTSPVHIATFDHLLAELAPNIPATHLVDESLLQEARTAGQITPQLAQRIMTTLQAAFDQEQTVVLCTCSTIGGCAEAVGAQIGRPVLRVDRAMADQAVALGQHIVVIAALASTLTPTRQLLEAAGQQANKPITLVEVLCEGAWARFEQGDQAGYWQMIAAELRRSARLGDVIVLAQASMAGAVPLCHELTIPILSSPRLGLAAALALLQRGVIL